MNKPTVHVKPVYVSNVRENTELIQDEVFQKAPLNAKNNIQTY